jgi:hypothetical protein
VNILILGCGPAGLMAAHAAAQWGHDIKIVSKKRKSEMFGAQYLHREIFDVDAGKPKLIEYKLLGTTEGYRDKVYGKSYSGTVSPEELEETHTGWNIRRAYDDLWDMYSTFVIDMPLQANDMRKGGPIHELNADLVISSLPAPALCLGESAGRQCSFEGQNIWAIGDAPERGIFDPIHAAAENSVVCNGEPDVGWYRSANVFGRSTTEWSSRRKPPVEGVAQVVKPLKTNCKCFPDIMRVGRYGKWQKGVLSHSAYYEVMEKFDTLGDQQVLF